MKLEVTFTRDMEAYLIEHVRENPALWDTRSENYSKKNLKLYGWVAIADELKKRFPGQTRITGEHVRQKWHNLKIYFRRLCQKQLDSSKSGSGRIDTPKWYLYDSMSFILDTVIPTQSRDDMPCLPGEPSTSRPSLSETSDQLQSEWVCRAKAKKENTKESQNEFPDLTHRPETHLGDSPPLSGKIVKETSPLESNKHALSILEALHQDSTFADVTLTAQGKTIKAHKAVLSAGSVYFKKVFAANPCQHPIVIMPLDVSYRDLKGIVDYIYKGELTLPSSELTSLLKAATALKISGLTESSVFNSDFDQEVLTPNIIRTQSERSGVSLSPINTQTGTDRLQSEGETSLSPTPCFVFEEDRDKAHATEFLDSSGKRKLPEYMYPEETPPDARCKIPKGIRSNSRISSMSDNKAEGSDLKSEEFGKEFEELEESTSQHRGHQQRGESPTEIGETECVYVTDNSTVIKKEPDY